MFRGSGNVRREDVQRVLVDLVLKEYMTFFPVCDTESDPCWGWLGLAYLTKSILTKQLNVNFL